MPNPQAILLVQPILNISLVALVVDLVSRSRPAPETILESIFSSSMWTAVEGPPLSAALGIAPCRHATQNTQSIDYLLKQLWPEDSGQRLLLDSQPGFHMG